MKLLLIREGEIDGILIPPLITTIAVNNNIHWPLDFGNDIRTEFQKGSGFGSVKSAVQKIIEAQNEDRALVGRMFQKVVILLDGKGTQAAQNEIHQMIAGHPDFIFGIAIKEVESWVLADRDHIIEWLNVNRADCPQCRFWQRGYQPESDPDPKETLNALVSASDRIDFDKWGTGAAGDFIEQYWKGTNYSNEQVSFTNWLGKADLRGIQNKCPLGFRVFYQNLIHFLR
jgi:hypothetical protein